MTQDNARLLRARLPLSGRCEGGLGVVEVPVFEAKGGWTPLLDGVRREDAWRVVDDIALALAELRPGEGAFSAIVHDAPALAVLFAYLSRARGSAQDGARAARYLELALEAAAESPLVPSFHAGLAGVGWAAAQLHKVLGLELDEVGSEIDMALWDHLEEKGWSATYDLIGGVVGVGAAALERLPNAAARLSLDWIIGHLEQTAEHGSAGITWWTDPAWLPPEDRARHPRGYHDLSVAHGVPAVAALLARAAARGIQSERSRLLCEGAVGWLRAQEAEYPSGLPYKVEPNGSGWTVPAPPSRLAWCQGDLGVAAVRMATASAAGRPDWADSAHALARRAAGRARLSAGVSDASFCHGAAGVGHLFNRLYQATGDASLGDAARIWFDQTLALRQPGRGIAGFATRVPEADGSVGWAPMPGLIDGASGIALALLAAASPHEPWWDGILLVSDPNRDAPT
jgi:lantibiotic biosynthesis protein